jgi:hypothetical protein
MHGEQVFFQLAATLIPVFLFVGAVGQRLHPGPWMLRRGGPGVAFLLAFAISVIPVTAEAVALTAALGNETTAFDRWLVAGTLCLASVAACLAVIWPLLSALDERFGSSFRVIVAIGTLVLGASSARLLDSGIQAAATNARFEEMNAALEHVDGRIGVQLRRAHDEEAVEKAFEAMGVENEQLVKDLVEPSPLGRLRRAVGGVPGATGRFARRVWAKEDLGRVLADLGIKGKDADRLAQRLVTTRPSRQLWELLKAAEVLAAVRSVGVPRGKVGGFLEGHFRELCRDRKCG